MKIVNPLESTLCTWRRQYLVCFLLVSTMLLPLALQAQEKPLDMKAYRPLPQDHYVLLSPYSVTKPPVVSDSLFHRLAAGVTFPVNRTSLFSSDSFLVQLRDSLMPLLLQQQLRLRSVLVRGAASPEGSYWNNRLLSEARTRQLVEWLRATMPPTLLPDTLHTAAVAEDYGRLLLMMQAEDDPDYLLVSRLLQECAGDAPCCKSRLQALRDGEVWRRLSTHYFPRLRQTRLLLWVTEAPQLASFQPAPLASSLTPMEQPLLASQLQPVSALRFDRRRLLALRTNLLHDFFYMPGFGWAPSANIQLEYYPLRGHYTYNAGFTFSNHRHWQSQEFFQVRDLRLELRRYFRGDGCFMGPFLSAYAEGAVYGFGLSATKGWEGEGGGAGLGGGYVLKLNRKGSLRLELTLDLGLFLTQYDPYVYGNPITGDRDGVYYYDYKGNASSFKKRNHRFTWVGPTNAGIHLTYDIVYRKKRPVGCAGGKGGWR